MIDNESYPSKIFSSTKKSRNSAVLKSPSDFTFHNWSNPTTCYHAHSDYIEIFIVTQGKLIHHFGRTKTTMQAGDAFIMMPGQYHKHSPYTHYSSQHINLTCTIPHAKKIFQIYFGNETPVFQEQLIHLNAQAFEMALSYRQLILKSTSEEIRSHYVKAFITFAFGLFHTTKPVDELNAHVPEWLRDFLLKLNDLDFSTNFNMSDIYALSNYSQTTLSREFKKHVGKTLIAYINELKLNYACNQLQHTDLSILSISSSLGFDSLSHFSHLFKKKYGITPLQYRKNN